MSGNGVIIRSEPIETVTLNGVELCLLSSGDGTEVILHRLKQGARWAMTHQEGWTGGEMLVVQKGTLKMLGDEGNALIEAGHTVCASPILQDTIFQALTDTEFLYVSSQPVFHFYSRQPSDLMQLAVSVEVKDGYTAEHCNRVRQLAMHVGEHMGIGSKELLRLNFGSFLHDVGKVKIPDEILQKPGKLTDAEWALMRKHTDYGAEILRESHVYVLEQATDIVLYHHEQWDGHGYHGLKGDEIPLGASIVAVVDSYDAMTTDRVYRKRRATEEALDELLRCREQMYRPDVVDAFIEVQSQFGEEA